MKVYFERQIAWEILLFFVGFVVWITFAYLYQWGNTPFAPTGFCFALFCMIIFGLFFSKMDTYIDDTHLNIASGIGFFKKKIALADIHSVSIVKIKWYYGIGIRVQPHGLLYRARFTDAVELKIKGSKRTIQIGSKDVERLKQAIEA